MWPKQVGDIVLTKDYQICDICKNLVEIAVVVGVRNEDSYAKTKVLGIVICPDCAQKIVDKYKA
jgi:hypothetical protein